MATSVNTFKIFRVVALPETPRARSMYLIRNAQSGFLEVYVVAANGDVFGTPSPDTIQEQIQEALEDLNLDHLSTARSISASGDATWTVTFDGSADVSSVITLSASGVAAGAYGNFSIDAKGRVTAARNLVAADIPSLPGSKINSDLTVNTSGNADTSTRLATPRNINGVAFDGTQNITINAVDATARIAVSEKGASNGVATLVNGTIPANQLPSFVDDVIEVDDFDKLPGRPDDPGTNGSPVKGKIYVVVTGDPGDEVTQTFRWGGSAYVEISASAGTADQALSLVNPRTISMSGDGTWSVVFDGSENVEGTFTLEAALQDESGSYGNLVVDEKGRVINIRALIEDDMPELTWNKVMSARELHLEVNEW